MTNTKTEFDKRAIEIDKYFQFLEGIDKGVSHIECLEMSGVKTVFPIDSDLLKILKANGFILLYNLIEAIVRKSIEEIFAEIYAQNLTFQKLTEKLKKLWISQQTYPFRNGTESVNHSKIHDLLFFVANTIIDKEIMELQAKCLRISGNIDAQVIREIANKIGFEPSKDGRDLETIKEKRNHLAHGNFSFCEIGQNYSVQDLIRFKTTAYDHLNDVLTKMSAFLTTKSFAI